MDDEGLNCTFPKQGGLITTPCPKLKAKYHFGYLMLKNRHTYITYTCERNYINQFVQETSTLICPSILALTRK